MTKSDLQLGKDRNGIFLLYSIDLDANNMAEFYLYGGNGRQLWYKQIVNLPIGVSRGKLALFESDNKDLKPGIYLVKLVAGDLLKTKKVIVN